MARITRRQFLTYGAASGAVLFLPLRVGAVRALAQVPGGTLPPGVIPKYVTPLVIPPAMPRTAAPPAVRVSTTTRSPSGSSASTSFRRAWGWRRLLSGATARWTTRVASTIRRSRSRPVGVDRCASSGSTSSWTRTGTICRICFPSTRRCTGRTLLEVRRGRTCMARIRPRTPARCRSSRTCTGGTRPRRVTATPRPGTCRRPGTSHPASRVLAPSTGASWPRRNGCLARRGRREARSSSTTTTSGRRRCGTTTTRWGLPARTSTRGLPASTCYAADPRTLSAARSPGLPRRSATPPGRATSRSRSRSRIVLQRRRLALLPGQPGFRGARPLAAADSVHPRGGLRGRERHLADLQPGVLRQHDGREREDLAVPGGRAAPLPLPLPERLQLRFLALKFEHPAADVWQIGTEGGFLPAPVRINDLDVQGIGPVILLGPPSGPTSSSTSRTCRWGQPSACSTSRPTTPLAASRRRIPTTSRPIRRRPAR